MLTKSAKKTKSELAPTMFRLRPEQRKALQDERAFLGLRSESDVVRYLLNQLAKRQAKRAPGWRRPKVEAA